MDVARLSLSMIFRVDFRSSMMGLTWRSTLRESPGWLFPDTIRLKRKDLIIATFLYTHCRSSPLEKGSSSVLLKIAAGVDLEALFFLSSLTIFVLVSLLGAWGWCRYHFLILSPYEGRRWGCVVFRIRQVCVVNSLRVLIRRGRLKLLVASELAWWLMLPTVGASVAWFFYVVRWLVALVIQEGFVNKEASLVIQLLFIIQRLRCTGSSDVPIICIWHSIVWAYKSDLLTSSWGLLPNYFYITRTLKYHHYF